MAKVEHLKVVEGDTDRPPSMPPPDPLIGRTIDGRYRLEEVLGEGGMGLVYGARHTVLNKPLAVKVLRPEVSKDEEIINRFRQEAQSASAIGNEHIIDISDFGTLPDGSTYFVMEFLEGMDLTQAIKEGRPMDSGRALHIGKQLCKGLGAAHERGIVHRDLKPDNIFLVDRGGDRDFVKVLDFGIAKVSSGTKRLTKAGQVFGTPHYMSPEQCAGTGTDQRTDIYALGVILYEMAAGHVPFDADNLMGILTKHMYEEPLPPHELPPPVDVPPALEAVILKCLAKKPELRYQTMSEAYADLARTQAGETPQAVIDAVERNSSTGIAARTALTSGLSMTMGAPDRLPGTHSRMPIVLAAAAALILIGIVIVGWFAWGGEPVAEVTPEPDTAITAPPVDLAAEAEAAAEAAAAAAAAAQERAIVEAAMVSITSVPPAAEVWNGEELLGNTPVRVPRPEGRDRLNLRLRLEGYVAQPVRISSFTDETVTVTLTPDPRSRAAERERDRARDRGMQAQTEMEATPPPVTEDTTMRTTMSNLPPQSEVIDPWGGSGP